MVTLDVCGWILTERRWDRAGRLDWLVAFRSRARSKFGLPGEGSDQRFSQKGCVSGPSINSSNSPPTAPRPSRSSTARLLWLPANSPSSRDMLPPSKSPRPILKRVSSPFNSSMRSARVHFPPSPCLSTFQFTHSPQLYDRSPLIVQPNACALPGRGERVYLAEDHDSATQDDIIRDSIPLRDGHPPPERPCEASTYPHSVDYSSSSTQPESDESDGSLSTPPDPSNLSAAPLIMTHPPDLLGPSLSRRRSDSDVIAFLPHPPSPPKSKRPKRSLKRTYSDKPLFGCTFGGDSFSTPAFEGCLGGF